MSESAKIARPYALAAFEFALAENRLDEWPIMLKHLVDASEQELVKKLLHNPKCSTMDVAEIIMDMNANLIDQSGKNFLKTLAMNNRLSVLPKVYQLFLAYRADAEKSMQVNVKSVIPLTDDYKERLTTVLEAKLSRNVVLQCELDPSLLGGLLIQAGDLVIDSSVSGQLNRLQENLVG